MLKNRKSSKKVIIIVLSMALVLAIAGGLYFYKNQQNGNKDKQSQQNGEKLNLDPPTDQDLKDNDANKQRIINEEKALKDQPQVPAGSRKQVTPLITGAAQYDSVIEVSSYVPGIFEDNGQCKFTFTKGSSAFTVTHLGTKEGNAVYCPLASVKTSEFSSKGQWNVTLNYSSTSATGTSEAKSFEVK